MLKKSVKITYAEPWLPFHHRLFIEVVETCSARFALKKRYDNYTKNVQFSKGVLKVYLSSAVLREELLFGRKKIIAMYNEALNGDYIKSVLLV